MARWLLRYALLFAFLFLAGLGYAAVSGRYGSFWHWPGRALADVHALESASGRIEAEAKALATTSRTTLDDGALRSQAKLRERLAVIDRDLAARRESDRKAGGVIRQLAHGGEAEVVATHGNRLKIRQLEMERDFLNGLLAPSASLARLVDAEGQARARIDALNQRCRALSGQADALAGQWIWHRYDVQGLHIRNKVDALRAQSRQSCADARSLADKLARADQTRRHLESVIHNLPADGARYADATADITKALESRWLFKTRLWLSAHNAQLHLRAALIGVALAIAMPFLIRILFYLVLAPMAARRPPILLEPGSAPMAPGHGHSAVSQPVAVPQGQELLVKQGYLHGAPLGGKASTRLLLSWRNPFASWLRGLFFLTRYRGLPDGATATISAGSDPFAELLVLELREGQACMMLPRLIVAVIQPVDRPLRIRGHWRLTSPHAWLTAQLRYLVFRGPATLVLKGYRGLHVIGADRDVELPQGYVVGFSANLSYGVVRARTFQPYFFKQGALLHDVVRSGPGIVLTEEAPGLAARGGGGRHGISHRLEDGLDVVLKFFGL